MNFGFESIIPGLLYSTFWVAVILSIWWRPIAGIYYLVPLIPAQTFRDRLADFPLGANVVTLVLLAVTIGLMRRGQSPIPACPWRVPLCVYAGFTFLSLCLGSFYLGHTLPISFGDPRVGDWRNYISMLFLVFLVAGAVTTTKQMKVIILLMCLSVFLFDKNFWGAVSNRDYTSYSEDLRTDAGAVGYAGVNGLAAFEAQIAMALMALAAFEPKLLRRLGYWALALFSAVCLMYSLSRAGYVALLAGWVFLGLVKYRKLLILLAAFVMTWTTVLPNAVVERVTMTQGADGELDHSSETRFSLWEDAMEKFGSNPVTGTGYDTFAYTQHLANYRDTHNIYVKVLVETGVVGMLIFLWLLFRSFGAGFSLFLRAQEPLHAALGLALAAWVVCAMAANFFGDRWTYLQVNGYMWVIAGMVARGRALEEQDELADPEGEALPEQNDLVVEQGHLAASVLFERGTRQFC